MSSTQHPAAASTATATAANTATAGLAQGRRANTALWGVQIITALFFAVASAMPKLVAHSSATDFFDRIGYGDGFMYLIGALELAGGIAIVTPRLAGVAALAIIGLMIGAEIFTFAYLDGENAATPVLVAVVVGFVAWGRRESTKALIRQVRRAS